MQYHLNGFLAGDPSVAPAAQNAPSDCVDVLIVGCGPAGLTLASQLSAFGGISTRIIERKEGPLNFGQADGIACRSVEMFNAFGFAERVIKEGYQVNEVCFWRPGGDGSPLTRADRIQDVEDDLSEMPHIILSQARIHDFYLETMAKSPGRLAPEYNRELVSLTRTDGQEFPVEANVACLDDPDKSEVIRAKFLVGCDGARSRVRSQLDLELTGDSARQLWGVMDVLCRTDFPDIRLKCAIQSADQGSILIIPREGGYLVRLYIELDELAPGERAADRGVMSDQLIAKAQRIFSPYNFEVAEVAWWSAYEIGQRVCESFDDVDESERGLKVPRIFIAGDACHTHSPKAGQGMNVSMADAFNLGWKLAAVVRKQSSPELLDTYSVERRSKAKELIDFDRDMARLFSEKPKTPEDAARFQAYFKKHGRYTAGVETCYEKSLITGDMLHQELATGYLVGKRFHSAPVVRLADAKPLQLGHILQADGRWRIFIFAPQSDPGNADGPVGKFCREMTELLMAVSPRGTDIDSVIDVRAVFQSLHRDMDISKLPSLLLPRKGRFSLIDYEKAYCSDHGQRDIFDLRGISRDQGAIVVVRPDHHVCLVRPIDACEDVKNFLSSVLRTNGLDQ